jgi:hypothetical protein
MIRPNFLVLFIAGMIVTAPAWGETGSTGPAAPPPDVRATGRLSQERQAAAGVTVSGRGDYRSIHDRDDKLRNRICSNC